MSRFQTRQTSSSKPSWNSQNSGDGGERDTGRREGRMSAHNVELPPIAVLMRRAVQLPIQRQVCGPTAP